MAFIMCDDHNLSVEADGIDPATARRLMLTEPAQNPPRSRKNCSNSASFIATATSAFSPTEPRASRAQSQREVCAKEFAITPGS